MRPGLPRRLLFTAHLAVGLTLGLLMVLLGLSGSLLVFRHEIDALLEPGLARAEPQGVIAPLSAVVAAARRAHPDAAVQHLFLAPDRGSVHEVWLKGAGRVFVDPSTAAVRGTRDERGTPTGWLFALHTELLGGENGERVAGYAGLGLLFLSLSGLVLWWPLRLRQVPARLGVKWSAPPARVHYDLHRSGGFWAMGLLALLALTGVSLAFSEWFTATAHRLAGTPAAPKLTVAAPPSAAPLPLDALVQRADAALPDGTLRRISFPAKPDAPLLVRKRLPGEWHPNGMNQIYLDPYRGIVLRVNRSDRAPAAQRLLNLRYPLHIGVWGGLATRLLYALAGLAPALLFITGCRMWWTRTAAKRHRARAPIRPPAPVTDSSPSCR